MYRSPRFPPSEYDVWRHNVDLMLGHNRQHWPSNRYTSHRRLCLRRKRGLQWVVNLPEAEFSVPAYIFQIDLNPCPDESFVHIFHSFEAALIIVYAKIPASNDEICLFISNRYIAHGVRLISLSDNPSQTI